MTTSKPDIAPERPVADQVDEREARQVAEAARQTEWDRPSFAKELYLGRFRLDLIHPHRGSAEAEQAATDAFLAELRALCETELDGSVIEREALIPDEYLKALARARRVRDEDPARVRRRSASARSATTARSCSSASVHPTLGALVSAHQSIGVPEPVKLFGTEEQKRAFLPRCARRCDQRVPADRARRRFRPGPPGGHRDAGRRRYGVRARRPEAVDDERRDRRTARRHGPGAGAPRGPRRHHRVRRRGRLPRHHRRAPQRVHGTQGHRERAHPVRPRAGARREPARPRGRRPQDRPDHA